MNLMLTQTNRVLLWKLCKCMKFWKYCNIWEILHRYFRVNKVGLHRITHVSLRPFIAQLTWSLSITKKECVMIFSKFHNSISRCRFENLFIKIRTVKLYANAKLSTAFLIREFMFCFHAKNINKNHINYYKIRK